MAHRYTTFWEPFLDLGYRWNSGKDFYAQLMAEVTKGWADWNVPDDHAAIGHCLNALNWARSIFNTLGAYSYATSGDSELLESIYWGHQEGINQPELEITWQAICEAWVKNNFEGMEWTIACIDRMRALMWDKPFNIRWAANPTGESS